jgi:ubiquinone/menaquinone biosynthesis C-methylase UbiE
MLARAEDRRDRLGLGTTLIERDIRDTGLPDRSFDAIVASFLFCVLPQEHQQAALGELARLCRPGGELRLLEYTRPSKGIRRAITRLWEPWIKWAYGAGYDRNTEAALPRAGFTIIESRFVVDELIKYIRATPADTTRQ